MKQIERNTLCYYCMGCNKQENENYKPVMRCKKFIQGIENWQEKLQDARGLAYGTNRKL